MATETPKWILDREAGKTCPRCLEARKSVRLTGLTVSAVYDHGDDVCAAQSVETFGPSTYSHPKIYRAVRA